MHKTLEELVNFNSATIAECR